MKRKRGTVRKTRYEDFPSLDVNKFKKGDLLWYWNEKGFPHTVKFVRPARSLDNVKRALVLYYSAADKTWKEALVDARLLTEKKA